MRRPGCQGPWKRPVFVTRCVRTMQSGPDFQDQAALAAWSMHNYPITNRLSGAQGTRPPVVIRRPNRLISRPARPRRRRDGPPRIDSRDRHRRRRKSREPAARASLHHRGGCDRDPPLRAHASSCCLSLRGPGASGLPHRHDGRRHRRPHQKRSEPAAHRSRSTAARRFAAASAAYLRHPSGVARGEPDARRGRARCWRTLAFP